MNPSQVGLLPSWQIAAEDIEKKTVKTEEDVSSSAKTSLPFVPALEGLRGVAVLLTEYVHIGLDMDTIPLGTAGVAIFFVLSGYLITGVLMKLQVSKGYSVHRDGLADNCTQVTHKSTPRRLLRFYNDRSVRLYPALLFMVVGITVYRFYWTGGKPPAHTIKDAAVALTYNVDMRFLFLEGWKTSYFPNVWSLSVEEKFYVFWSLVLPTIIRMSDTWRSRTMTILILSSMGLNLVGYFENPWQDSLFISRYAAVPNIYKMLIGASLRLSPMPSILTRRWSSWFGLVATALPVVLAKCTTPINTTSWSFPPRNDLSFEIIWEIWPTLTGAMIMCGCIQHGNWLLECRPLRFIGRISYAWYLWQLPLLLVTAIADPWDHGYRGIATTCTALVMAMISTFCIEEPLRDKYHHWKTSGQVKLPDRDGRIA